MVRPLPGFSNPPGDAARGLTARNCAASSASLGNVLTVTRLDRLARSTRDLLNTLATITGKGAGFRSLHDTWADTTTAHGRLMLTVLGGLAEFERELIQISLFVTRVVVRVRKDDAGRFRIIQATL
jgi:DNA invertase Pin-like site-specific DNA recombinase